MTGSGVVSVVVPVFQVEPFLDRCVDSIVRQTYTALEIILVDDGSPDNCPALCDCWARKDSRIKVIHKNNGGLSDARNSGMKQAKGEYLSFIDSDDWIAPSFIEKLISAIERDSSDIAACSVEIVWEDNRPGELLTVQKNALLDREEAQLALFHETLLKQPVWYKLYRQKTIEGILFEVGKHHEDVFWSYQAVGRAQKVSVIDYIGYYYYQRSDSIMGKGFSLKTLDVIEAYEKRYEYCLDCFPKLASEAKVAIVNGCIYHGQMALLNLKGEERKHAFDLLNKVKKKYTIEPTDYYGIKATHRIWLFIAKYSLLCVCRIKNMLRIGL